MKVNLIALSFLLSCSINVRDPNTSSENSSNQSIVQAVDNKISTDGFKVLSVIPDNNCFVKLLMMSPDSSLYVVSYYIRGSNKLYKTVTPIDVRF